MILHAYAYVFVWLVMAIQHYQVLPLRAWVDLGAMAMKGYYTFLKVPGLVLYSHLPYHNDSIIVKTDAHRKTHEERKQEDFFNNIYLSLYCKGSKGLFKGLHVRGCWRPNINFIFWPHCYDRHVVSFLFSWMLNQRSWAHSIVGFPRAPSVGCGFPYHFWSLGVWNSTGNCFGTQLNSII